jgi:holo-[acyl-carrier protein] synthase
LLIQVAVLPNGHHEHTTHRIDVVSIDDATTSLERFGERYLRRVFTEPESAYSREGAGRIAAERFAARFAAKEAAVKTLRPDGPWTDWSAIEIYRHATGWCNLVLHREAAARWLRASVS